MTTTPNAAEAALREIARRYEVGEITALEAAVSGSGVWALARTQRTNLPDAYVQAQRAWHDLLLDLPERVLWEYPLLRDLAVERRRLVLYGRSADVRVEVATPTGVVVVRAYRAAQQAVWDFELVPMLSPRIVAPGYWGVGVLSPRSVEVRAAPMYGADGRFAGIEAVAKVQRRHSVELVGAEWLLRGGEWVCVSPVGRVECDVFPRVGPWHRRIGDVLLLRAESNELAGCYELSRLEFDSAPSIAGNEIVIERPTVVSHPDHPSLVLEPGTWYAYQVAYAVIPRVAD
ncbi:MAG: hypothetical protein KatS3mg109_1344 [Pirellulaceae bacterium]|nr:MAG: hypothetical protein KatS3mg109_1206 [Pirellulaceae bacterium]GIW90912.1 MAG: hypothetical protein KatS3mg109_1344 [Pirellulaceae bacterium]